MASQPSYAQHQPSRNGGQGIPQQQQHFDQLPSNPYAGYPGAPQRQDSGTSASGSGYAVNGASGHRSQAPRSQQGSGRERDRERDADRRAARQRERADLVQYQEPQKDVIAVDDETCELSCGLRLARLMSPYCGISTTGVWSSYVAARHLGGLD